MSYTCIWGCSARPKLIIGGLEHPQLPPPPPPSIATDKFVNVQNVCLRSRRGGGGGGGGKGTLNG